LGTWPLFSFEFKKYVFQEICIEPSKAKGRSPTKQNDTHHDAASLAGDCSLVPKIYIGKTGLKTTVDLIGSPLFKMFVTYLRIHNLYKHYIVLFATIFKVRRGEQWNVQESMMDLLLEISCVYRSQENQQ